MPRRLSRAVATLGFLALAPALSQAQSGTPLGTNYCDETVDLVLFRVRLRERRPSRGRVGRCTTTLSSPPVPGTWTPPRRSSTRVAASRPR